MHSICILVVNECRIWLFNSWCRAAASAAVSVRWCGGANRRRQTTKEPQRGAQVSREATGATAGDAARSHRLWRQERTSPDQDRTAQQPRRAATERAERASSRTVLSDVQLARLVTRYQHYTRLLVYSRWTRRVRTRSISDCCVCEPDLTSCSCCR